MMQTRIQKIRRALAQSVSDHWPLDICFNNCPYTFCFYICFSFQQSTGFSIPFSLVCSDSALQSVFHTNFEPSPTVFCKNLEQCFNCCSNNCFLSVQCAREAASQGASWPGNRVSFESGGAPFFEAVFETNLFTQKSHIWSKTTQQVTNLKVFRKTF